MKTYSKYLLFIVFLLITTITTKNTNACEFHFEITSNEKEVYSIGDELIVKVTVTYTHRVCPKGIDATKFNFNGIKVLGATKWKTISNGKYERKLKLKITKNKKNIHMLNAVRTCDKDGGTGTITFSVN